ncbi:o-succinylbenzoate synthase [Terribacillus saccharophilus]|uniref:o-succinylbenzoate synthase n=1 Tax=Terribacillus saccharophilus TaxID=361277 RepID=A0A268HHC4_9BACI|nr:MULTISPECIES: o-succinylbenzoate synthase [Terribacillus]PAE09266.1 o-succinylbenzoate synthase [Terribacillus saccharophilus]
MELRSYRLFRYTLPLKQPFTTHAGALNEREGIIVELQDNEGRSGFGEGVAFTIPFYTSETVASSWILLQETLLPLLFAKKVNHPTEVPQLFSGIVGNQMAKAAVEGAAWDLYAKQQGKSLAACIGGRRTKAKAGAVISLSDDLEQTIEMIRSQGFERAKLKVAKYNERRAIELVKEIDPELPLLIDGNGMYKEEDISLLAGLDSLNLQMIEQPFIPGDIVLHQRLQQRMNTSICLDETVESFSDAWQALELGACRTINIKIGRVGGLTEAIRIHNLCQQAGLAVWCGGMVETGISKAHNLALASLPGFSIPGDLSGSDRYFDRDLLINPLQVEQGSIRIPDEPGIGVEVDMEYLLYVSSEVSTGK